MEVENHGEENDYDDESDEERPFEQRSKLSLKDTGVILILSTLLSVSLVAGGLGVEGIKEKLWKNDLWDILGAVFFFICLFAFISFVLVKIAVHYLVYLALGTLLAIIFPVSPRRRRRELSRIFSKAEKPD